MAVSINWGSLLQVSYYFEVHIRAPEFVQSTILGSMILKSLHGTQRLKASRSRLPWTRTDTQRIWGRLFEVPASAPRGVGSWLRPEVPRASKSPS